MEIRLVTHYAKRGVGMPTATQVPGPEARAKYQADKTALYEVGINVYRYFHSNELFKGITV